MERLRPEERKPNIPGVEGQRVCRRATSHFAGKRIEAGGVKHRPMVGDRRSLVGEAAIARFDVLPARVQRMLSARQPRGQLGCRLRLQPVRECPHTFEARVEDEIRDQPTVRPELEPWNTFEYQSQRLGISGQQLSKSAAIVADVGVVARGIRVAAGVERAILEDHEPGIKTGVSEARAPEEPAKERGRRHECYLFAGCS